MKKLILKPIFFGIIILLSQSAFAQFIGTSPAVLNGRALIKHTGPMPFGLPGTLSPRMLTLDKDITNLVGQNTPFESVTTGLRLTHKVDNLMGSISSDSWDMAASASTLYFRHANSYLNIMNLNKEGKVGIRTVAPDATLHVKNINGTGMDSHLEGFTLLDGNQASLLLGAETGADYGEWGIEYNPYAEGLNFWKPSGGTTGIAGSNYHLFIANDGKVSMGLDPNLSPTFNGDYKLYVADGIMTEKVKVAIKTTGDWSDYVFDKDYELKSLTEVESFINENKHLPGVPSAEEVVENGIDMAQMDAKLLEKIEELTLYIIKQEKRIQKLENSKRKNHE